MKGNKIDELFRNGMTSHKISPPSAAWDKIEQSLPEKNNNGVYFWLKIAASIVLVAVFGWIALNNNTVNEGPQQDQQQAGLVEEEPKDEVVSTPEDQKATEEPSLEVIKPAENKSTVNLTAQVEEQDVASKEEIADTPSESISETLTAEVQEQIEHSELELLMIDPLTSQKPLNFIDTELSVRVNYFDFNGSLQQYINSQEALLTELPKRKKFSLLSGIVSVAKGVNNGKVSLSEFRKSKNEFFINDLKYGEKAEETEDEDEDAPNDK